LVRVAIDVGSHNTDGQAKRFKAAMLQKAQRSSTESVPSIPLTKVWGNYSAGFGAVPLEGEGRR